MGMDVEALLEYFKSPRAGVWDYLAVAFLLLLLIIVIVYAWREHRIGRRARHMVNHYYDRNKGGATRRTAPRLTTSIPVRVSPLGAGDVMHGEILDISSGGVRLVVFEPGTEVERGMMFTLAGEGPPLESLGAQRMEVVNVSKGPREDTPMLHGKWVDMDTETQKSFNRAIRRRLLYGLE